MDSRERPEKILIVSNCVSYMLEGMLQLLTERHRVSSITFWDPRAQRPDADTSATFFSGFDVVFWQKGSDSPALPVSSSPRVVSFPPVFFYGLHPDLIYAWKGGKPLQGPLGDYNSSIVLYAFLHGIALDRVVSLFNRVTYEALGFFEMFEESCRHYLSLADAEGFNMRPHLVSWLRRGAFMYSVNHPKSYVLQDVAKELLARVDVATTHPVLAHDVYDLVPDLLANGPVFPVYPEVGLRLGIRGEYLFKAAQSLRRMPLDEFVAASYAAYRAVGATGITSDRLGDPRYARLLDAT
jgi:hypothetical protein